jgi:integrase
LSVSGVYRLLESLAKKGKVEGRFNPHAFRHGLARRLLKHQADMGTVSQLLGHEDIETTHLFYARWRPDELTDRYNQFGGPLE